MRDIILVAALLANIQGVQPGTSEVSESKSICSLPQGWDAVEARDPEFIVFGELHGTREAPALFSSLACSLAQIGKRLLIAIEFSPIHDDALQRAWNADEEQLEDLLLDAGWRGRADGVGSEAMFAMVRDLHRLRRQGYAIDITAFNGAGDEDQMARFAKLPGQGPHEAAQAENIAIAAQAGAYDRVLVLVGNLHAMKKPYNLGSGRFDPMARRLEAYGSVLSFRMKHGGGTNWSCQRDCIVNAAKANGSFDRGPFIAMNDGETNWMDSNFDGFYWIGPISASPPKARD